MTISAYTAAQEYTAYFLRSDLGYLQISGDDQLAFLQRQTTNDVRLLKPGKAVLTVLTSPTARILDAIYLLPEQDGIGLVPLPGQARSTAAYLKSRIFFMDKVKLRDTSDQYAQMDLIGPQISAVLDKLEQQRKPVEDEVLEWETSDLGRVRALGLPAWFGLGVRLIVAAQALETLQASLVHNQVVPLSAQDYEILRVEAGLPATGAELVEAYTPLEAGLAHVVADDKGCYTGQEVIARQRTYDKVTQGLCGLRLAGPAVAGQRIWAEGRAVGQVTSAVQSARFGHIALAIIKRPHHVPGTTVWVGEQAAGVEALVSDLPF